MKSVPKIIKELRALFHNNHITKGSPTFNQIGCGTEIVFPKRKDNVDTFWGKDILKKLLEICGDQLICMSSNGDIKILIKDSRDA